MQRNYDVFFSYDLKHVDINDVFYLNQLITRQIQTKVIVDFQNQLFEIHYIGKYYIVYLYQSHIDNELKVSEETNHFNPVANQ